MSWLEVSDIPAVAICLVALAQISIRSRSCIERSLTRLFEMSRNMAAMMAETMQNTIFQSLRLSYIDFIVGSVYIWL